MLKKLSKSGEKGQAPKRSKNRRSMDLLREFPPQNYPAQVNAVAVSTPMAGRSTNVSYEGEQGGRQPQRHRNSSVNTQNEMPPENTTRAVTKNPEHITKAGKARPQSSGRSADPTSPELVLLENPKNENSTTKKLVARDLGNIDTLLTDLTSCKSVLSNCTDSLIEAKKLQEDYETLKVKLDTQSTELDEYKRRMERYETLKLEYRSQGDELQQYKMHLGSLYSENKDLKGKEETWEKDKKILLQEQQAEVSTLKSILENELSRFKKEMEAKRAEEEVHIDYYKNRIAELRHAHGEELTRVKKDDREERLKFKREIDQQIDSLLKEAATEKANALMALKQQLAHEKQKQINEHHTERGKLVLEYTKAIDSVRKVAALDKNNALEGLRESFIKEKADLLRQINITRSAHQEKPPHWKTGGVDL